MQISIIIPVYNVEEYLRECLDSVLVDNKFTGQVVCVNDGSTDGCAAILEEYKKNYPNVEVYSSHENQGQSVARNTGLDKAKGDYVLFLDSDDYFTNGAIDYLTRLAADNPDVDFFYMDCAITTSGERFYTLRHKEPVKMPLVEYYDYEYAEYRSTPQGCVWGGFFKRNFIERNHLRMLPKCRYEDELFIFEVFLKDGICMALHVEEPYYYYRVGREGATTAKCTLTHFSNRSTIARACFEKMMEAELLTDARKRCVMGLCEENLAQSYLHGFENDVGKFVTKEDARIMKACAMTRDEKKMARLARVSPRLCAAYRAGRLPEGVRRIVNLIFER